MNYAKINQEVVKAFIEGTKYGNAIPGYWINDKYLFITIDGFKAYILPKDKVYFNTDNIKDFQNKPFDFGAVRSSGCDIKATWTYVRKPGGILMRKFKGERDGKKWNLYVDNRMLKPIENEPCVVYTQLYDEKKDMTIQPIAAFMEMNGGERIPLMLVLPVRVYDETDFD